MRHKMKVNQLVLIGFGIVFAIMIAIEVVSYINLETYKKEISWVTHTYEVKLMIAGIKKTLIDAETGQRGFLYTKQERCLKPYNAALKIIKSQVDSLQSEVNDNPTQVARIEEIRKLITIKLDELAQTIKIAKAGDHQKTQELVFANLGKRTMDTLRAHLDKLEAAERELLEQRIESANFYLYFSNLVSIISTIIVIIVGFLVSWYISRSIMLPIKGATSNISSSLAQVSAALAERELTAAKQSSAANQTATTMDELDRSADNSTKQARSVVQNAQQVMDLVLQGIQYINKVGESTIELKTKVNGIAEQISQLGTKTNQIRNIIDLVSDLAGQTNLLALNAAIEAVRAGEHGRGFAVVATEIRKLADESKKSAEEINSLVVDIQHATDSTVMATKGGTKMVEDVARIATSSVELLDNISTSANNNHHSVQQILLNMEQQAEASHQILQAIAEISNGAKEILAGVSQTKDSIKVITNASQNLTAMV